jgi:hypothetical protein
MVKSLYPFENCVSNLILCVTGSLPSSVRADLAHSKQEASAISLPANVPPALQPIAPRSLGAAPTAKMTCSMLRVTRPQTVFVLPASGHIQPVGEMRRPK